MAEALYRKYRPRVMRAEAEAKAEARRRVVAEDAQAASETEEKGGE